MLPIMIGPNKLPNAKGNKYKLTVFAGMLLARGVAGDLGAADGRGASPGSTDGSHLPAASASAEELIAFGLEPRHPHSRLHLEPLQDLSRSRMDSPQIAFLIFPSAVPELSVDPGDRGDEAVGLDGAKIVFLCSRH